MIRARRRSIGFLNWAHFLDHYVILIFPTVVIGLEAVYGRSYGELLVLSTAAFTAFGLFALPSGWLADKWSRRNMIAVYFSAPASAARWSAASDSFETLAIALFGVGLFAAIYHPVGTPMVVDAAVMRGRTMAFNGICGNIGVSIASGCTAVIADALGWRYTFLIPAVDLRSLRHRISQVRARRRRQRVVQAPDQDVALSKSLTVAVVILFLVLAFWVGLVFNALTIMLPKLVEQRLGFGLSLTDGRRARDLRVPVRRHGAVHHGPHGRAGGAASHHVGDRRHSGGRHPARLLGQRLVAAAEPRARGRGDLRAGDGERPGAGALHAGGLARAHLCDPLLSDLHDGGAGRVGHRPALRAGRLQRGARRRRRDRGARRAQHVRHLACWSPARRSRRAAEKRAAQQRAQAVAQPAE